MRKEEQKKFTDAITYEDYCLIETEEKNRNAYQQGKCQKEGSDKIEKLPCIEVSTQWYVTEHLKEWFMHSWKTNPGSLPLVPHNNEPVSKELLQIVKCTHDDYLKQVFEKRINEAQTDEHFQDLLLEVSAQVKNVKNNYFPKVITRMAEIKGGNALHKYTVDRYNDEIRSEESILYLASRVNCVPAIRTLSKVGYQFNEDTGYIVTNVDDNVLEEVSSLYVASEKNDLLAINAMARGGYNIAEDKGRIIKDPNESVLEEYSSLYIASHKNASLAINAMARGRYKIAEDKGRIKKKLDGSILEDVSSLYTAAANNASKAINAMARGRYKIAEDKGEIVNHSDGCVLKSSPLSIAAARNASGAIDAMARRGCKMAEDRGRILTDIDGSSLLEKSSSLYTAAYHGATASIKTMGEHGYPLDEQEGLTIYNKYFSSRIERALDKLEVGSEAYNYLRYENKCRHGWAATIYRPQTFLPSTKQTDWLLR